MLQGLKQAEGDYHPTFLPREASGARNWDRTLTSFSLRSARAAPLTVCGRMTHSSVCFWF